MESLASELRAARAAAREAGALVARYYHEGTEVWSKGGDGDDPVTRADLEADAALSEALRGAFPEDGWLSEETDDSGERLGRRRVWIVDPLDGTRQFVNRVPELAVSVALVQDGRPVVGVLYNPIAEVELWATAGGGAHRNGRPVRVSPCAELERAVVAASRSELAAGRFEPVRDWFAELRPTGAIAWKLATVASGALDFNVSFRPKSEWDVAAGDLLVHEAGGVYHDAAGEAPRYNKPEPSIPARMAAGNAALVAAFHARAGRAPGAAAPEAVSSS